MKKLLISSLFVLLASCSGQAPVVPEVNEADLVGEWRAVLGSPGGELPFGLRITSADGELAAVVVNDTEILPISVVLVGGRTVRLEMPWYDSELEGELSHDGITIAGRWRRTVPGGNSVLDWKAERGTFPRFSPAISTKNEPVISNVSGIWKLVFTDDSGDDVVRGEFVQVGERVTGTMLTSVGDYRYLDGSFESGLLRLSTFDGAHAFLFTAQAQEDGRLVGDFWSRDSYHATWVGERVDEDEQILRDPWQEVNATREDRVFRFSFPDLDNNLVSNEDTRFSGRVLLVNIFGSWCPNCNDEAPLLADWHRRWSDDGLEIVGLAFEFSGNPERDRRMLGRFASRYGIEYPLLLAGISDKVEAAKAVPDISEVISYPTTIFIGRDGAIRWIHSGFAGPGTGPHHERLVAEIEQRIQALLAE